MLSFEVQPVDLSGAPGVTVQGEVDLSTAQSLEATLDEAIRSSAGAFVVDLSELEFLDSSGLSVLLRARALLGREERALAVICPPGPVRRLLDLSGAAELLFLYPTREDAAAALVRPDP